MLIRRTNHKNKIERIRIDYAIFCVFNLFKKLSFYLSFSKDNANRQFLFYLVYEEMSCIFKR